MLILLGFLSLSVLGSAKAQQIFEEKNYIFMAIGLAVITLGFLLMSGGGSDNPAVFDASIFDFRRIHLAPALVLLGFAIEIYAILLNPTKKETQKEENK